MKRIVSVLLCALLIVCAALPAFAEETPDIIAQGDCGYNAQWTLEADGTLTVSGEGSMWNYSYMETGRPSYELYKDQIKRIVFEDGITRIGYYAFYQYSNLTGELQIPSNITDLGDCAFEDCSGYTSLCLNEGLRTIGFAAFRGCNGFVRGLVFPSTLEVIGLQAFSGCSGFRDELILPDNLTELGGAAFRDCRGLTGNVELPGNLNELNSAVFQNCIGLNGTINLGNNITAIGSVAFFNCSSLKGDLTIPDSVTSIGAGAFYGCVGLQGTLTLSSNLVTIGDSYYSIGAFERCEYLQGTLTLPESLTKLGQNTFCACKNLSGTLYLPESLKEIGKDAFHACAINNDILAFFSDHMKFLKVDITAGHEATCTESGYKNMSIYCADCNSYLTWSQDNYPAHGHTLTLVPATEATAELNGNIEHYRCADCGTLFFDEDGTRSATEEDILVPYIPPEIKAEEILLNAERIDLIPGETFQLTATVLPDETNNKTVNWYTEPSGVINVDWNTGLVTANTPGTTFVTCFSNDGPLVMVSVIVHDPGTPVYENISVEPTCVDPGRGDVVTYCLDCGSELSREPGTVPPTGQHIGYGREENVIEADCIHPGSYDYIICCVECGEFLSSEHYETKALGHTPDKPIISGTFASTCTKRGSHIETVSCVSCGEVISIETVDDGYGDHAWNDGDIQSGEYDRYTVTNYTCTECGASKTERTVNPDYQFRCSRCDWFDANRDKGGVYGIVAWLVHMITHLVQQINYWT